MSDRSNSRPGDHGELTDGDVQKLVAEVFLAAMRPYYDLHAEKALASIGRVQQKSPKATEELAFETARAHWLNGIENVERRRAQLTVRRLLSIKATPLTELELAAEDANDDKLAAEAKQLMMMQPTQAKIAAQPAVAPQSVPVPVPVPSTGPAGRRSETFNEKTAREFLENERRDQQRNS